MSSSPPPPIAPQRIALCPARRLGLLGTASGRSLAPPDQPERTGAAPGYGSRPGQLGPNWRLEAVERGRKSGRERSCAFSSLSLSLGEGGKEKKFVPSPLALLAALCVAVRLLLSSPLRCSALCLAVPPPPLLVHSPSCHQLDHGGEDDLLRPLREGAIGHRRGCQADARGRDWRGATLRYKEDGVSSAPRTSAPTSTRPPPPRRKPANAEKVRIG